MANAMAVMTNCPYNVVPAQNQRQPSLTSGAKIWADGRLSCCSSRVNLQGGARELWAAKQSSPIAALPRPSVFAVSAAAVTAEPPAAPAASKQKIRIKLRSYWVHLIQQACQQILDAAKNSNAETMGPVPLPTKKRIYCVLRSPHVDKDSREHFEIRTHYRLIDLANPNAQTIDALMQLDLPAGVDVEVKL